MCYILGTKAPGSAIAEKGCSDPTPPLANKKLELPYPLYFAKERSKWGKGGVAFIDPNRTEQEMTIGKMYLITEQQFKEVVSQENNVSYIPMDLKKVIQEGSGNIGNGWYRQILYVGEEDGYPIFTFTNPDPMDKVPCNPPNTAYLSTIAAGLLELGYHKEAIVSYFLHKQGIQEHFTKESLYTYLFQQESIMK